MSVAEGVKPKDTIWHLTSNSNVEQKTIVVNNNFTRGNKRKKRK